MWRLRLKTSLFVLFFAITILMLLVLALPSILSTPWGREQLITWVNQSIPGEVSVQNMRLSWFGQQQIEGLELRDTKGHHVLSIKKLTSDIHPYQLLTPIPNLGTVTLTSLDAVFTHDENGLSNVQQSLGLVPRKHEDLKPSVETSDPITIPIPFTGTVSLIDSRLSWADSDRGPIEIHHLSATLTVPSLTAPIATDIQADLHYAGTSSPIRLQGQMTDSRAIKAQVKGPEEAYVELDGQIVGSALRLQRPLILTFKVTPQLTKMLLANVPFLKQMISTDQPVTLTIEPEGFSLPLSNPSLTTIRIPKATLEAGRIQFQYAGQMATLISLLKTRTEDTFPVLTTPLFFSLTDGVFRIQRVDALVADQYPLALWGKVDFPRDRVNMTIGVTARALSIGYGLTALDPRYMLLLSLSGKTREVTLDNAKAAARIAALVVQSQKGEIGLLVGGAMNLVGLGFDQSEIPPPTSPLPWDDQPLHPSSSKQSNRTPILDKVQKGIFKGTEKVLNLFR